ncbi:hypothetical protein DWV13_05550 [Clostridium botulinum]|uniref:hypothetical protein n=1 Tax=Clostridium TaxID=1485 RepID=UPI0013F6B233|nr:MULTISPECIES: hypothetical protein [Clostridium]MCS6131110.1 hypothetical protein [Clostridium botulinum]NFL46892.1 hypothetical protein [Clostridium botulinum]NFL91050.1 hypothetical protein [Clostridium botulinum]
MNLPRIYSVNEKENIVTIDKDFFEALFINQPLINNRTLSSISLRLAALLLRELDEFEARELPPRKRLAESLNTSRTSIINSLVQLEECGFILRQVSILQSIIGPSEEEKDRYYKIGEENFKKRNFSDKFSINPSYNQIYKTVSKQEFINEFISSSNETLNNSIINEMFINKLYELEERIKRLEEN